MNIWKLTAHQHHRRSHFHTWTLEAGPLSRWPSSSPGIVKLGATSSGSVRSPTGSGRQRQGHALEKYGWVLSLSPVLFLREDSQQKTKKDIDDEPNSSLVSPKEALSSLMTSRIWLWWVFQAFDLIRSSISSVFCVLHFDQGGVPWAVKHKFLLIFFLNI